MAASSKTGLVVSAHPGDFVWRAGGAIALHAKKGYRVKIVCLSYGERGESQFAWKVAGVKMGDVKAQRKDEAQRAADLLGAEIEFFDAGDYPLRSTPAMLDRLIVHATPDPPPRLLLRVLERAVSRQRPTATANHWCAHATDRAADKTRHQGSPR